MKFCAQPGCKELVERGRCPKHTKLKRERERRYYVGSSNGHGQLTHEAPTEPRYYPPVHYGRRWQRVAKQYLADHPFCVTCQQEGHVTIATQCDHVIPHRGDPALFWDPENWQPLCRPCHSAKTAREVGLGGWL